MLKPNRVHPGIPGPAWIRSGPRVRLQRAAYTAANCREWVRRWVRRKLSRGFEEDMTLVTDGAEAHICV